MMLIKISIFIALFAETVYACKSDGGTTDGDKGPNKCGGKGGINNLLCGDITDSVYEDGGGFGGEVVTRDSDLDCSDWEGGDCLWHNVGSEEDDEEWRLAEGDPDKTLLKKYTGTDRYGESSTVIAYPNAALDAEERALLVSNPMSCLNGEGKLKLKHWISDKATLEVCVRMLGEIEDSGCQTVRASDNPGPTTVTIDPVDEPFEIYFYASGFSSDEEFVIIDDVSFSGDVCGEDTTTRSTVTTQPQSDDRDNCGLLSCNFEPGSDCNKAAKGGSWRTVQGRCTNNKNTGIRYDGDDDPNGYFACVQGPETEGVMVFSDVVLVEPKLLRFRYFKASYGALFRILVNDQTVYEDGDLVKQDVFWKNSAGEVYLPAGNNEIKFVASNMEDNHFIGLDNLELLNDDGTFLC